MTTRAGVLWAVVVWAAVARVTFWAIWQKPWKRPTTMNAGWKARQ